MKENKKDFLSLDDLITPKMGYEVHLVEDEGDQLFLLSILNQLFNEPILGFDTEFTNGTKLTYLQISSKTLGVVFNFHKLKKSDFITNLITRFFTSNIKMIGFSVA